MSVLELTDEQVISLVRQLPSARKNVAAPGFGTDAEPAKRLRLANNYAERFAPSVDWIGIGCPKINARRLSTSCCTE